MINLKAQKTYVVTIITLLLLYALSMFIPGIKSYSQYPLYYIKCGHQPIAAYRDKTKTYITPGSRLYQAPSILVDRYYCDESEALDDGYTRSLLN